MRLRSILSALAAVWLGGVAVVAAQSSGPFEVQAVVLDTPEAGARLVVSFTVPPGYFLYADHVTVETDSGVLGQPEQPAPEVIKDPWTGEEKEVYRASFEAIYPIKAAPNGQLAVEVSYQGCNDQTCFFPVSKTWVLPVNRYQSSRSVDEGKTEPVASALRRPVNATVWQDLADKFQPVRSQTGYVGADAFRTFVLGAGSDLADTAPYDAVGWLSAILLILVGGLALNLTPCVLPMIPVNLAIIGAGSQAGSKTRGFALGLLYGAGIALTYGILGLVAVLTGSTFGTLNASPWFNWIIAVVFVVLALAMFDVLHVDFSRFQNRLPGGGTPRKKGGAAFGAALFMGIVAALLAGACVAPVVISVLVWSGNLYAKGVWLGLLLPFVLGIGMALPWPLAGAGMAVLPRPGGWMNWIKRGFGVLIILLALYYAKLGVDLFQVDSGDLESGLSSAVQQHKLAEALQKGLDQDKPVLIDFWATWCKNCTTMDKTTFKDTAVQRVLMQDVIFVKYAAENPEEPQTKQVLSAFGVKGLPTYVILQPSSP